MKKIVLTVGIGLITIGIILGILVVLSNTNRYPSTVITSTECEPPCWYGIWPGETTSWGVTNYLMTQDWIDQSSIGGLTDDDANTTQIKWQFNRPIGDMADYAYFYDDNEERYTKIDINKAVVICSAGHTVAHLEEIGIAESMRHIMINDRLLGVGITEASMVILGGMMPGDDTYREQNLEKVYKIGKTL